LNFLPSFLLWSPRAIKYEQGQKWGIQQFYNAKHDGTQLGILAPAAPFRMEDPDEGVNTNAVPTQVWGVMVETVNDREMSH
jgi:hypothetical protein